MGVIQAENGEYTALCTLTTVSEAAGYAYLIIHKQFIIQNLIEQSKSILLFIAKRHWDVYTHLELRNDCKFSKLFMYLKRAPASSGRALLWCDVSWWPSAAGGSATSATLSLFSELQVK